jgi:hypothetical protein
MLLMGTEVTSTDLASDGSLTIVTADGDRIFIDGMDDTWDESWSLGVRRDSRGNNDEEIICMSDGRLVSQ